jgi:hypothetical protein
MYQVTIECRGINPDEGPRAAIDIENEFRLHRPWHEEPKCTFSDGNLVLCAKNKDKEGKALLDEFGDCLVAYLRVHGKMHILSGEQI